MKKEDLIEKGLLEEQAKAVLELYNTSIKEYVAKVDYDNANSEIATLNEVIKERDTQLKQLKDSAGDNEELKKQIEKLQADNDATEKKYKAEVEQLKINSAIEMALTKSGARTIKAVKAMLNMDNIKFDKDGNITGLDEQIKGLVEGEDTKYLFNDEQIKGAHKVEPGTGGEDGETDFNKMTYTEMCAYLEANPGTEI